MSKRTRRGQPAASKKHEEKPAAVVRFYIDRNDNKISPWPHADREGRQTLTLDDAAAKTPYTRRDLIIMWNAFWGDTHGHQEEPDTADDPAPVSHVLRMQRSVTLIANQINTAGSALESLTDSPAHGLEFVDSVAVEGARSAMRTAIDAINVLQRTIETHVGSASADELLQKGWRQ